jgi:cystathionine beta-lyase
MISFDQPIDRKGTQCFKWDYLLPFFGNDTILPMTVADMDFAMPDSILEALRNRLTHPVIGYTGQSAAYWQSMADWMTRRHGWAIDSTWLVDMPGVLPAMNLAVQVFTQPGDKVMIQTPVYDPFFHAVTRNGRKLVTQSLLYQEGKYVIDFDDMEQQFRTGVRMFILCSPHNPVGRVWAVDELQAILLLCQQYDVWLVSDEIHHDIVYPGHQHTMVGAMASDYRKVITLTSPTKSFNIQGLTMGCAIIPDQEYRKQYHHAKEALGLHLSNTLSMVAYEAAYTTGENWLNGLLNYLDGNRQYLAKRFADINSIDFINPEGTYIAWMDARNLRLSSETMKQYFVDHAGVGLNKGTTYGSDGEGFMRMNFALPRMQLMEATENIIAAAEKAL